MFNQLKAYVDKREGVHYWKEILNQAGLTVNQQYFMMVTYPDQDYYNLLEIAAEMSNQTREVFLESFGRFLGTFIMTTYGNALKADMQTLDLMGEADYYIHKVFDIALGEASSTRKGPHDLTIIYTNKHRCCPLFIGVIKAVAEYYKEVVVTSQSLCVLKGHPYCEISVHKT